jgi:hypothetical protein
MIYQAEFMIVSGNGRNTGKTSFVCRVIRKVSQSYPITAIKVSPHFHPNRNFRNILISEENYMICRENDPDGTKDSSRMLRAGAKKVYYIEAKDSHLEKALKALLENVPTEGPVICESGGMRQLVEPSLSILLNRPGQTETKSAFLKLTPLADRIVMFNGKDFDFLPEKVLYDGKIWVIK